MSPLEGGALERIHTRRAAGNFVAEYRLLHFPMKGCDMGGAGRNELLVPPVDSTQAIHIVWLDIDIHQRLNVLLLGSIGRPSDH